MDNAVLGVAILIVFAVVVWVQSVVELKRNRQK